jgi:DivIVA domain-containing protein
MTQDARGEGAVVAPGSGAKITPLDIQQKEFRVSRFGGYRMRDVDEFLDQLTGVVSEMVEENARLRRQAGASPVVGSPDLDDVARQADEIIQRARDEAARIDAEARARSVASGTPAAGTDADRAAVKAFLSQEREFLQSLAGLVQGHAETVKGMAKSARRPETVDTEVAEAPAAVVPEPPPAAPSPDADAVPAEAGGSPEAEPAEADRSEESEVTDRVVEVGDAGTTQRLPAADERAELAQARPSGSAGQDRGNESDPSLRELFWGEED